MKHSFTLILIMSLGAQVFSQTSSTVRIYLNEFWKPVTDSTAAEYYRIVEPRNGKFLVKDYYMSGQLQMEALCTSYDPKLTWEGITKLYHENGVVSEEGPFKDEERYGFHRYWYDNGARHKEVFIQKREDIYHNYWSRSGESLLTNGSGLVREENKNRGTYYIEIEDSVQIASFNIIDSDTVYMMVKKIPEYKGGYQELARDISSAMKYPKAARKAGVAGTVYVQFVVDKNGKPTNYKVMRGISPECDEEAVRAVSTLHGWEPGLHKGKSVKVRFVLPIKFRLH